MSRVLVAFNTSRTEIEHGIAPPLAMAVTIPIEAEVDGIQTDAVVIYIGASAFASKGEQLTERQFRAIASAVIEQLKVREG